MQMSHRLQVIRPNSSKLSPEIERMIADRTQASTNRILTSQIDSPRNIRKAIRLFRKLNSRGKLTPANDEVL